MKEIILLINNLLIMVHSDPGPVDIPLDKLPAYYAARDKDAKINPIPYDTWGSPPDLYPAIIPEGLPGVGDDYVYDNITYPGLYSDNRECNSVDSCPNNPSDPHAPGFGIGPGFMGFGIGEDTARDWKCHVETDCYGMNKIPDDIQNNTEVLFLRSFNWTTLQNEDLSSLPPLIKLRIEYSDLVTIRPAAFASQKKLQYLELEANFIADLGPRTFVELSELTSLDLGSNKLSSINRETFEGLRSLEQLNLGENELIEIINDTFREAPSLRTIKLEMNKITTIDRFAFRGLKNLTTLNLGYNLFTKIPNFGLRLLPSLTSLHLSGNRFSSISKADFRYLKTLKEIWLDECELRSIPKRTFKGLNLTLLDISANELAQLKNLGNIGSHVTVQMGLNPWECDCSLTRMKEWLKIYHITLSSPEPTCKSPRYFAGRKITRLTNEELCGPPPVYPPTTARSVVAMATSTSSNKKNSRGKWSDTIYAVDKLYTVVPPITQTTRLSTSQPTEEISHSTKHIQTTKDQSTRAASTTNGQRIEPISKLSDKSEAETSTALVPTYMILTLRNVAQFTATTEYPLETDPSELVKVILIVLSVTIFVSFALVFIVYRCSSNKNRIEETDVEMPSLKIKLEDTEYVNGTTAVISTKPMTNCQDTTHKTASYVEGNKQTSQPNEYVNVYKASNSNDDETANQKTENVDKVEKDKAEENHTNDTDTASPNEDAATAPSNKEESDDTEKERENKNNETTSKEADSTE